MFNGLLYARKLEAVGISRSQAEAHVELIADVIEDNLATKQDLKELEFRLITKLSVIMGIMFTAWTGVMAIIIDVIVKTH